MQSVGQNPREVLDKGWTFSAPFAVLVGVLFWLSREAEEAAIHASLTVLALGLILSYRGARMKPREILVDVGGGTFFLQPTDNLSRLAVGLFDLFRSPKHVARAAKVDTPIPDHIGSAPGPEALDNHSEEGSMTGKSHSASAQAFHDRMHANHMYGLWELAGQMTPQPQPKIVPYLWPWSVLESLIEDSSEAVPVGDERRALQLFNPGLEGRWATTSTMIAAVQVLLPGEVARAHRHTPTAIRFIIEGSGAYTAVDGERLYMEPGDLILTPSWAWHDHGNETKGRVVWMDGLDVPLVQSVDAMFFQFYSEQQVRAERPPNASKRLHGHVHLGPTWIKEKPRSSPLLLYSWDSTWEALGAVREQEGSPFDGVALEYRHPQTGGPVLPTMACWVQMLRPGERTQAHRHTGSAVYHVVRGKGETIIDGQRFAWGKGDFLVLTPWAMHEHANTSAAEEAVLFSIQDRPVLEALGLYYEEALSERGGHQEVKSNFSPISAGRPAR